MGQLFQIAFRNLALHKKRTFLLGGAIAGVTLLLLLLLGLSNGVQENMLRSATTLMTGHVNIGGFYKITAGQGAPIVTDYGKLVAHVKQNVPELDFVVDRGRGWGKLVSDTGSVQVGIGGINLDLEQRFPQVISVESGTLDSLRTPGHVMIFKEQAQKLEVKVGDQITLTAPTMRGSNNTLDLTVGAIAKDMGLLSKFNVFVPNQDLRKLYQINQDTTGALYLYLKDMKDVAKVQERLRKSLAAAGYGIMDQDPRPFWEKFEVVGREDWVGQKLDVTTWEDEVAFTKWTLAAIYALTVILTVALLIVIAVGIMNSMAIAIRERTREIGTLRAIGMQRGHVLRMFLVEAFLLGLFSALSGALLSVASSLLINGAHIQVPVGVQLFLMSDTLRLAITGAALGGAVAFMVFCVTLISLIPSYLAARLKPVTAMHHIG